MKNKKSIIAIFLLCLTLIIGTTFAFFSSDINIENIFNAGTYKTITTEVFTSPTKWKPGDETPKTIKTKNEGTLPVRVRIKLTETWTSQNNNPLPLYFHSDNTNCIQIEEINDCVEYAAIINFDNTTEWRKQGDYYYYIYELNPGEETSSPLKSITYNPNVEPDVNCTNVGGVYTCESAGDGYDGATYQLNITTETIQADAFLDAWNLSEDPSLRIGYMAKDESIDFDTYQETGYNVFVKRTYLGDNLKSQELGFILNGNLYYIKGGGATLKEDSEYGDEYNNDSIYYEDNKRVLINAFGSENCEETEGEFGTAINCSIPDSISASAGKDGSVGAQYSQIRCVVFDTESSFCE